MTNVTEEAHYTRLELLGKHLSDKFELNFLILSNLPAGRGIRGLPPDH